MVHGSVWLRSLQGVASGFVKLIGRVEVGGQTSIDRDGPLLLAMNHCSMLDGPLLCDTVARPVACLIKAEAFKPGAGWLLRQAGQISVERDQVDPTPVRRCLQILRAGGCVGIFPEGTRGIGRVAVIKPGVGYLALRSGATVVPVAGHGTSALGRSWRRPLVRVEVGAPIAFDRVPDNQPLNREQSAAAAEVVRAALARLVHDTQRVAS